MACILSLNALCKICDLENRVNKMPHFFFILPPILDLLGSCHCSLPCLSARQYQRRGKCLGVDDGDEPEDLPGAGVVPRGGAAHLLRALVSRGLLTIPATSLQLLAQRH